EGEEDEHQRPGEADRVPERIAHEERGGPGGRPHEIPLRSRRTHPGRCAGVHRSSPAELCCAPGADAGKIMADVIVVRFALIDLIGKGGSGSVWRAWDSKAEALCAAKVLRQRDSADLMRFVREKGVSFAHPHLLTPYGWGAEDEHVVIAMPLVSGGTLERS